jgi:uncharacterized protein YgiB involved in biofilm formation
MLVPAALLAGCGKSSAPKKADAAPPEYGVYISSADCAESGKLSEDLCIKVINTAVAIHQKEATVYKFLQKCEAAEGGADRCDKTGEDEYRPRLQAFYVTLGNQPSAVPLYPPKNSVAGFRTATKQAIDARDQSLHISNEAMTVANENTKLPKTR